jgi:8-oxo-dGTP diphosphatase
MAALKQVAIAILRQADRYLMQLRDPLPTIVYPGEWGLFGGHLEADETPEAAVWRELYEEIGYTPPTLALFTQHQDARAVRYVFQGELTVAVEDLNLQEGWDCGLLTLQQIQQGEAYSAIAQKVCPVGGVHRQLLLDFHERLIGQGDLRSP